MHELSVCRSLLEQVNRIAAKNIDGTVKSIHIQVGPLSGVEPALLQSAFPVARSNTLAAQADLVIHSQPIRVKCQQCAAESEVTPNKLICGECGDYHTVLLSGDELLLERIEFRTEH